VYLCAWAHGLAFCGMTKYANNISGPGAIAQPPGPKMLGGKAILYDEAGRLDRVGMAKSLRKFFKRALSRQVLSSNFLLSPLLKQQN
jgi:hypothetical protein